MPRSESRMLLYTVALFALVGCIEQKPTQISVSIKGSFLIKIQECLVGLKDADVARKGLASRQKDFFPFSFCLCLPVGFFCIFSINRFLVVSVMHSGSRYFRGCRLWVRTSSPSGLIPKTPDWASG